MNCCKHCQQQSNWWVFFGNMHRNKDSSKTQAKQKNKWHTLNMISIHRVKHEKCVIWPWQLMWCNLHLSLLLTMMHDLNVIYHFSCLYCSCFLSWLLYPDITASFCDKLKAQFFCILLMQLRHWAEWREQNLYTCGHSQSIRAELGLQQPPPLQEKHGDVEGVHIRVRWGSTGH